MSRASECILLSHEWNCQFLHLRLILFIWISALLVTQHTPAVGTTGDIGLLTLALAMAGDEG